MPRRQAETKQLEGNALDKCTITIQFKSCPVRFGFAFRYPQKKNVLDFFCMKQNCLRRCHWSDSGHGTMDSVSRRLITSH